MNKQWTGHQVSRFLFSVRNQRQVVYHILLLLVLTIGMTTSVASRATAAPTTPTFTVNTTFDGTAPGACNGGLAGCSLREAIIEANHFPGAGVTINIPAGTYGLTIVPSGLDDETTGDLNITANMTITGAGAASTIIDANQIDRAIFVDSFSVNVTISNVTVRNGLKNSFGGGINNFGALTLNSSIISNNSTSNFGGGIASDDALTLTNSTVNDNHSSGPPGSGGGGGIWIQDGTLALNNSTVSYNSSSFGGGIGIDGTAAVILNSTISNNSSIRDGGGIAMSSSLSTLNAYFTTIAGNLADSNSTGAGTGGGISTFVQPVTMKGTLLGQNYAGTSPNDCTGSGTIVSQDYNLLEFATGCTITGVTTHNITGFDPLVDSARNNGGPTQTRALFDISPAKDAIPTAQCTDQFGAPLTTDQRGFSRPSGSACDIGAYEGSIPLAILGSNFILNGDGEGSAGSPTGALVGTPYWTCCLAVVPYGAAGGFPTATDPGPANRGLNFFAGGNTPVRSISQFRGVQAISPAIDAGKIHLKISSNDDYFGGFANQDDYASLRIQYLDGSGSIISTLLIDGPTASGRGNQTGLFPSGVLTDLVPVGTRTIKSILEMTRVSNAGTYNDGYADNLSFVLVPPPLYLPLIRR